MASFFCDDFHGVRISYKTYGQLAADKSNVIVVPSGYTLTMPRWIG
jgi:homoserine acetyltransferase